MADVLIVDDETLDREAAERCLRGVQDIEIRQAGDGEQARQLILESRPDLVLTDLRMPGMNGLELVEWLRNEHPGLPVILMTSQGSEKIAVKALAAGAASYIPKRHLKRDLVSTVTEILEVSESSRRQLELLEYLTCTRSELVLPNDLGLISGLIGYFQQALRRFSADDTFQTQVGIALMEALTNAIVHGNLEIESDIRQDDPDGYFRLIDQRRSKDPYRSRRVRCSSCLTKEQVEFTIEDEGPGFEIGKLASVTEAGSLLQVSGRGILLMRTFMDEVSYNEKGNRVHLVKWFDRDGTSESSD